MKDLVAEVSKIFIKEKISFILIGALARDLFLAQKNLNPSVRTKDIDFAILVDSWDEFEKIKKILRDEMGMVSDPNKIYRLIYKSIPIDLLPFGKIAEPGENISWPGRFRSRIRVMGFREAYNNATSVLLDGVNIRIIIPEMFVALKLSSWSSGQDRKKDAIDIRLILENIKALCPDLENDFHNEENESLLEKYGQDEDGLWISVFGSRIQTLLKGTALSDYLKNLMSSDFTINTLLLDFNYGNIPDEKLRFILEKLLTPLRDGLKR